MNTSTSKMIYDVLIVGAGIAGLSAAKVLEGRGFKVAIVDKGRGLGGRLATRRIDDIRLDHGAQYFTASDPRFQAEVETWLEKGTIKTWFDTLTFQNETPETPPRLRYIPSEAGMNSLPKALAQSLKADLYLAERVIKLTCETATHWHVDLEEGRSLEARQLILTAPVPQILALLEASQIPLTPEQNHQLTSVQYAPSMAVMAVSHGASTAFQYPQGLAFTGDSPIRWLACNVAKYAQNTHHQKAFTLHATPEYSKQYFDLPDESVLNDLLYPLEDLTQVKRDDYKSIQIHRWRYALVETGLPSPVFALDLPNTYAPCHLAGDAFGTGAKIETAWLSGLETSLSIKR